MVNGQFFTDNDSMHWSRFGVQKHYALETVARYLLERIREKIEGGRGDDHLRVRGDDILIGFRGFDVLQGGEGDDVLRAGCMVGGFGSDEIYGGFGRKAYDSMRWV